MNRVPYHPVEILTRSRVEIRELVVQNLTDEMTDGLGDVPTWAAGPLSLFFGRKVAKVGNPGGNGEPDPIHQSGDRGQGPANNSVQC